MLLNKHEIITQNLLKGTIPENYGAVSYDLSAATIITLENELMDEYKLPPQGMAVIVSFEEFNLKGKEVVGYTTVKNTLSRKGIMAVNIGLIDPGYEGPISSILMNFGKTKINIKKGDTFLRMTFHSFTSLDKEVYPNCIKDIKVTYDEYVEMRKNEANTFLDPTFLYLKDIQNRALEASKVVASIEAKTLIDNFKSNFEYILKVGGFAIAVVGIVIAAIFNIINYNSKPYTRDFTYDLNQLEIRIKSMQDTIRQMKSINDSTKRR